MRYQAALRPDRMPEPVGPRHGGFSANSSVAASQLASIRAPTDTGTMIDSARRVLLFSSIGHALMHMMTAFYAVIVLTLAVSWNLPAEDLLRLYAPATVLLGVMSLPAGWASDRFGAPVMMVVMFFGLGLSSIACGFVPTGDTLMLSLALCGIGTFGAIYHSVGIGWVIRTAKEQGHAMGVNGLWGSAGLALYGIVPGVLITLASWRAAFIVPGLVCIAVGAALVVQMRQGKVGDRPMPATPGVQVGRREFWRVFSVLSVTMALEGVIWQAVMFGAALVFEVKLAPEISALAHELQRERGASAIYLGSKGQQYGAELDNQRQATDAQLAKLSSLVDTDAVRAIDIVAAPVKKAIESLASLAETRKAIAEQQIGVADMAAYYTPVIRQLLASVEKMAPLSRNADITRAILAYADGMASQGGVDDATFEAMKKHFSVQEIVERDGLLVRADVIEPATGSRGALLFRDGKKSPAAWTRTAPFDTPRALTLGGVRGAYSFLANIGARVRLEPFELGQPLEQRRLTRDRLRAVANHRRAHDEVVDALLRVLQLNRELFGHQSSLHIRARN